MMLLLGAAFAGVAHNGTVDGSSVLWESTFTRPSGERCVPLARPFHGEVEGATLEAGGSALCSPGVGVLRVTTRQGFPAGEIELPLADGVSQRIVLGGARFEPSRETGLEKGMMFWATPGMTQKQRRAMDREQEGLLRLAKGTRLYVTPTEDIVTHGLTGELREPTASVVATAGVGALFLLVMLAMGLAYRKLERGARRERVDAWLKENGSGEDTTGHVFDFPGTGGGQELPREP